MTDPADPATGASGMPPAAPLPRRRWLLGAALFLSLSLNLLVIGVVAGSLWVRGGPDSTRRAAVDFGSAPYLAALHEDDRAALRRRWAAEGGDLRRIRAERQADLAALAAALRAQPHDPAAVAALLAATQARTAARQSRLLELLAERLAGMDAAERAAYADRLEAGLRRGPRPPSDRRPRAD